MSIYLIGPASGPYKIGYAKNVAARLSGLQTGNGQRLLVHLRVDTPNDREAERALHERFRDRRLAGEWFNVTVDEVAQALDVPLMQYGEGMTAKQFCEWLDSMAEVLGYSQREVAERLGVTPEYVSRMKKTGTTLTMALACRAIRHRMGPEEGGFPDPLIRDPSGRPGRVSLKGIAT